MGHSFRPSFIVAASRFLRCLDSASFKGEHGELKTTVTGYCYDLGDYLQDGNHTGVAPTVDTRFGSKQDRLSMVSNLHRNGIPVYSDIVLNQVNGGSYEYNPAVKYYIQKESYPSYPTSTVRWVYPNLPAGTKQEIVNVKERTE